VPFVFWDLGASKGAPFSAFALFRLEIEMGKEIQLNLMEFIILALQNLISQE
jgi:hypothetical protein